jgi:hypothetical protein
LAYVFGSGRRWDDAERNHELAEQEIREIKAESKRKHQELEQLLNEDVCLQMMREIAFYEKRSNLTTIPPLSSFRPDNASRPWWQRTRIATRSAPRLKT